MVLRKRIYSDDKIHFVTFSVYRHIDVFTNKFIAEEFIQNLNFYFKKNKYKAYAYVVMPTHVHLLVKLSGSGSISDLIRDIKKFFSYKAKNLLSKMTEFDLKIFNNKGKYQFWERGFDEVTIHSKRIFKIKLKYIMNNPVKAGLVERHENYPFLYVSEFDKMGV